MATTSLPKLLATFHGEVLNRLHSAREAIGHSGTKGTASETVWLDIFTRYLPARYHAENAQIVDSKGAFSDQIDVVIYDRQYTPFIFSSQEGVKYIPAEGVYAVFEAKQTVNAQLIEYAAEKAESVRKLHRTSLPIPHAGGTFDPKPLNRLIAGVLAFESEWRPAMGPSFEKSLKNQDEYGKLDLGCVVSHGLFLHDASDNSYTMKTHSMAVTVFVFELIRRLQALATVPMIDIGAYANWLDTK